VNQIILEHLRELTRYPDRHVGGQGNRAATAYFAEVVSAHGWAVSRRIFDCIEWEFGRASLEVEGETYVAHAGPYSLAADLRAPVVVASTVAELRGASARNAILLLRGELAAGQLMPKNFTFYNPDAHKRIISAIEAQAPAAVVAATGTDPYLVGGQSPFPLFEDGDFDIPNSYLGETEGESLAAHEGQTASILIDSKRIPTTAEHVIARVQGAAPGRIVVSAHIDSRKGSPGALDNATGVATLLGLAELLGRRLPWTGPTVELVPFNGEDNYANPGEMLWVAENEGRFGDIVLGINVDDSGQVGAENNVSYYNCPPEIERAVRGSAEGHPRLAEGPQWVQGDHSIYVMNGVPAIAIASSEMRAFMREYAHTERDTIDLADPGLVADAAHFISESIDAVARTL
jgi:aminopeptidase YwaD